MPPECFEVPISAGRTLALVPESSPTARDRWHVQVRAGGRALGSLPLASLDSLDELQAGLMSLAAQANRRAA